MDRVCASSHIGPFVRVGRTVAIGVLIFGMGRGVIGVHAAEKAGDLQQVAPLKVASTALDSALNGPLAVNYQQERPGDDATNLDAVVDQLRRERNSLVTVRSSALRASLSESDGVASQRESLKQQINGLMSELARRPKPEQKPADAESIRKEKSPDRKPVRNSKRNQTSKSAGDRVKPSGGASAVSTNGPVDPMALGQALFRTGDYEGALKAFELAKKSTTVPRDRNVIKYFSAACLKKLGNVSESTTLFREVANSKADDVLAECAQWQLSMQQWRETTLVRIEQLRAAQTAEKADSDNLKAAVENETEAPGGAAAPPAE